MAESGIGGLTSSMTDMVDGSGSHLTQQSAETGTEQHVDESGFISNPGDCHRPRFIPHLSASISCFMRPNALLVYFFCIFACLSSPGHSLSGMLSLEISPSTPQYLVFVPAGGPSTEKLSHLSKALGFDVSGFSMDDFETRKSSRVRTQYVPPQPTYVRFSICLS